jgi:hypothetical protein
MSDELKPQATVDTPEFSEMLALYLDAAEKAQEANNAILLMPARRALVAHIDAWGARLAGMPFDLSKVTRWTFDGGMTATVDKDGQWIAYKDIAWRLAAAPTPKEDACGS